MIWHSAELNDLINELGTDEKLGLSSEEAQRDYLSEEMLTG